MSEKQYRILVVEDEKPLAEVISAKLERGGFEVVTARSVDEARKRLDEEPKIDAVWLDHYLLGGQSGLDFVVTCKQGDSACRSIPIFVVSNTATADKVQAYLKLGVTKYYVKAEKKLEEIITEIKETVTGEAE